MNIFRKTISRIFKKPQIPEDVMEHCLNETRKPNRTRLFYSAPIVVAAMTAITSGYILNAFKNGQEPFFLVHIITNTVYLFLLICCFIIMKIWPLLREQRFNIILHIVCFLSLFWASVFCVFDHNLMNLTMGLFIYSIFFAIKPRVFLFIELLVLVPLLAALSLVGMKDLVLFENYIKIIFVGVFSGFLSFKVYHSTMEGIANKKLIEMESEAARDALLRFETIWNWVECGIVIIDARTRQIIDINPVAARMFGGERTDIIGKSCYEIFYSANKDSCPLIDFNQEVDRSERVFMNCNGDRVPIIKSVTKITYNGQPALLECFTDISDLKKAEEQLRVMGIAEKQIRQKAIFYPE
jgi:PAS domain S-box-containing protein